MGKTVAYVRVSAKDQNEDRQMIAMHEVGVPKKAIYMDKQSGKDFNRPAYKRMMRKLKEGDTLYIKSIDRLGRNYEEILEQWRIITKEKRADVVVLDMPLLDTKKGKDLLGTFIADLVLALLSYVSENERRTIKQRQAEGIAAAKRRGVKFGKAPAALPDNFHEVYQKWKMKKITVTVAAEMCGMKRTTFFERARAYEKATYVN